MNILSLREFPQYMEHFISYISRKWADERSAALYRDCLLHTPGASGPLPQWYLLEEKGRTLGCAGLIPNDFISRADLWPWLCALYVEPEVRGRGYGRMLIGHVERECRRLGFPCLYLTTDHTGYYEQHDFSYLGQGFSLSGETSRIDKKTLD